MAARWACRVARLGDKLVRRPHCVVRRERVARPLQLDLDARMRALQHEENRLLQENAEWVIWRREQAARENLEPVMPPGRDGDDNLEVIARLREEIQQVQKAFFDEQSRFSDQLNIKNKAISDLDKINVGLQLRHDCLEAEG